MNVLILSAGRRVSLLRSFETEIGYLGLNIKVYTADAKPFLSPACYSAIRHFELPPCDEKEYLQKLYLICKNHNIRLVIPTIDLELLILSKNLEFFNKSGIEILVSSPNLIEMANDKKFSNKLFLQKGIKIPKEYLSIEDVRYPCFVKPKIGNSSIETSIITTEKDFRNNHWKDDTYLKLKYLPPNKYTEYSCDLYFNKTGSLICIVPRERIQIRGGEVSKSKTEKNCIIPKLKKAFSYWEGAKGCITIQVFKHNITHKIFGIEINPRFGGGYPLTYSSGANYTKWILQEYLLNKTIETYFEEWEDNLIMLRYDQEVYVHSD